MKLNIPQLLEIDTVSDISGNISVVEFGHGNFPNFQRTYFLHNLAPNAVRGAHAHRQITQFMIAISGSFKVELEHRGVQYSFGLSRPQEGLMIPPLTWRNLSSFSQGAVCLVLATSHYDESEYIRDYGEFNRLQVATDM